MQNCIDHACDVVCSDAQYLVLRTPTLPWRPYPHTMAAREIGAVSNHHPAEGKAKINAALGYVGVTDTQDHAAPRAWTPNKLMLAACVFAAGVVLWRIKRLWRRHG